MSRISTRQQAKHDQAKELLKKEVLTYDEKYFVYENFHEGAENLNGLTGAFFTPMELAHNFRIGICGHKVIDLCAGIGILTFNFLHKLHHDIKPEITCVEINPQFVEIGKKLLPEANWICADITDPEFLASVDGFDFAYGNPPFGAIKTSPNPHLKYTGADFEYKAMEIAGYLAPSGQFIIPQESAPFRYSGVQQYESNHDNPKYQKFHQSTGSELCSCSTGVDSSLYINEWKGVKPMVEIVDLDTFGVTINPFKNIGQQQEMFA